MPSGRSMSMELEIPTLVRHKLEAAEAELADHEWRQLPHAARRRLGAVPTDTRTERHAFRMLVSWMRNTFM